MGTQSKSKVGNKFGSLPKQVLFWGLLLATAILVLCFTILFYTGNISVSLENLAADYKAQGKYAEAESLYKLSLAGWEKVLGPDSPNLAVRLNDLAALYQAQGKYAEAESLYKRSLVIDEKAHGQNHPSVAGDLNQLADLYQAQGKYAEAEPLYNQSVTLWEKAFKRQNEADVLENYAALLRKMNRHTEADKLEARAKATRKLPSALD